MFGRYAGPRPWLYALLWMVSAVELGLTAFRLHHTKSFGGFREGTVIALLVVSLLTLLWVPYALMVHFKHNRETNSNSSAGRNSLMHEASGGIPLWVYWLIAAALFTHKYPTRGLATLSGQRNIVMTIIGLAWTAFTLLTIIKVLQLMHGAAVGAHGHDGAYGRGGMVDQKTGAGGLGGRTNGAGGNYANNTNGTV